MMSRHTTVAVVLTVALALAVGVAAYAAVDPALVVYLPFDENAGDKAMDASGMNNNAAFKGATKWGEGKYGSGIALTAKAHLEVPHHDSLNLQSMTLMAWVRLLKDTGDHQSMAEKGSAWKEGEYNLLGDYNNHVLLQIRDLDAACADTCEAGDVMDAKWHHIAGTWDGKAIRIYVDGQMIRECPCNGTLAKNTDPLFIGARGGASRWTEGFYDEIKVFGRALSSAEVSAAMALVPTAVRPHDKTATTWATLKTYAAH
jgi:hypothetical protein